MPEKETSHNQSRLYLDITTGLPVGFTVDDSYLLKEGAESKNVLRKPNGELFVFRRPTVRSELGGVHLTLEKSLKAQRYLLEHNIPLIPAQPVYREDEIIGMIQPFLAPEKVKFFGVGMTTLGNTEMDNFFYNSLFSEEATKYTGKSLFIRREILENITKYILKIANNSVLLPVDDGFCFFVEKTMGATSRMETSSYGEILERDENANLVVGITLLDTTLLKHFDDPDTKVSRIPGGNNEEQYLSEANMRVATNTLQRIELSLIKRSERAMRN